MGELHDSWLEGIGVDVDRVLETSESSVENADAVAAVSAGTGARGGRARELEESGGPSGKNSANTTSGGKRVGGTVFSAKTAEGDEAELLSGEGEVRGDGSVSGKGFVARVKKDGEEGEFLSGEFEAGEDGASGKAVVARVKKKGQTDTVGEVEFSKKKAAVVGIKRETDVAEATGLLPEGAVAKGDAAVGTASLENSFTEDGISVGAQANIAEGSITLGTSGTKREDGSNSDRDETLRVGLSAGGGLAGRVHFGDADKDGNPEVGVGADFGPVSYDIKSEDPLRTADAILNPGLLPSAKRALTDDGSNLTKETVGSPKEGVDAFKELTSGVKNLISGDDD